jgi:hypothetical protein
MSFLGPIRTLLIAAMLWLPLTFFVWFAFRQTILIPVGWLCSTVFGWWAPELFLGMEIRPGGGDIAGALSQHYFYWQVALPLDAETQAQAVAMGKTAVSEIGRNPLVFGYSLPLFAGLVMATPLSSLQRIKQLAIGLPILMLFQSFGVTFDVLQVLCFQANEAGLAAVQSMGINREIVALCYQLGYLILPSISPIIIWIALNRVFIELLVTSDSDRVDEPVNPAPPTNGTAP